VVALQFVVRALRAEHPCCQFGMPAEIVRANARLDLHELHGQSRAVCFVILERERLTVWCV
jgi:hypothetical protein